ncbi:hypothetical protein ACVWXN_005924 [Bradyrhizobium sp. i1.4.4]
MRRKLDKNDKNDKRMRNINEPWLARDLLSFLAEPGKRI